MQIYHNSSSRGIVFGTNETERVRINDAGTLITQTGAIINESGVDADFRVESNSNATMLFVDGGNDRIGIGHSAPATILDIHGTSPTLNIRDLTSAATGVGGAISLQGYTSGTGSPNNFGKISGTKASGNVGGVLTLSTSATNGTMTDRMTIAQDGAVTVKSGAKLIINRTDNATGGEITYGPSSGTGFIFNDANGDGVDFVSGGSINLASFNTAESVFNDGGVDKDFRVESNNNTTMFFVDGSEDNVCIGTASGQNHSESAFVVVGRTELGNGSTTQGSVLITDQYSSSANDHILNIGTQKSSGGPFMSYGLGQDGSSADWVSTYDNFSGSHQVLIQNGAYLQHDIDMSNSQTTVGSAVTLQRVFESGRNGIIINDQGHSSLDTRIESGGNQNMLFVDAGNNSVNIGTGTNSGYMFNVNGAAQIGSSLVITSGGGANLTQGDIMIQSSTSDSPSARGQGVFMFNEGADQTWYAGTGYNAGAHYHIGFAASTSSTKEGARTTNAVFSLYNNASGAVFNENSADRDFRVESNNNANAIFVDGGNDTVTFDNEQLIHGGVNSKRGTFAVSASTNRRIRISLSNYAIVKVKIAALRTNAGNSVVYWEGYLNNNDNSGFSHPLDVRASGSGSTISYTFTDNGNGTYDWDFNNAGSGGYGSYEVETVGGAVPSVSITTY